MSPWDVEAVCNFNLRHTTGLGMFHVMAPRFGTDLVPILGALIGKNLGPVPIGLKCGSNGFHNRPICFRIRAYGY